MSKRESLLLIEDMLESALKIMRYTNEMDYDTFLSDERTVDAVVRNFEIIGEEASRLDLEFRNAHQDIEWNRIMGISKPDRSQLLWDRLRNRLDNC